MRLSYFLSLSFMIHLLAASVGLIARGTSGLSQGDVLTTVVSNVNNEASSQCFASLVGDGKLGDFPSVSIWRSLAPRP